MRRRSRSRSGSAPRKAEALERLSRSTDRPKSWLLEQALEQYLLDQACEIEAIEAGVKAAESGDVVSYERVREWLMSWRKPSPAAPSGAASLSRRERDRVRGSHGSATPSRLVLKTL
jgi:predicted transcriptional regulator